MGVAPAGGCWIGLVLAVVVVVVVDGTPLVTMAFWASKYPSPTCASKHQPQSGRQAQPQTAQTQAVIGNAP